MTNQQLAPVIDRTEKLRRLNESAWNPIEFHIALNHVTKDNWNITATLSYRRLKLEGIATIEDAMRVLDEIENDLRELFRDE